MRKFTFLVAIILISSCSVENTPEEFTTLDAQATKQVDQQEGEEITIPEQVCAGEAAEFCLHFPQATKGNGDPKTSQVQVQIYDESLGEFIQIFHEDHNTEACFSYTFDQAGVYDLRYFIGSGGHTDFQVTVENCCQESFTYSQEGDDLYTFTYVAGESMEDAELVFTFAQAVAATGFEEGWERRGQTFHKLMDLTACQTYFWTLTLTKTCMGSTNNNNVWTDFKVNDVSKKGDLANIVQSCD